MVSNGGLSWWAFLAGVLLAACASSVPPTHAKSGMPPANGASTLPPACRGSALDAERIAATCAHERPDESAPGSEALRVELEPPAAKVASGTSTTVVLRYRNVSPAALEFQLNAMCGTGHEVRILRTDGTRADLEEEVGGLGLCGTVPGIRVVLEPNGVLTQTLPIDARTKRWAPVDKDSEDSPLELVPGGPLRAGKYTLDVALPLYTDRGRRWESQLHVQAPLVIVEHE